MPLPRWLRTLLPQKPAQSSAPPPARWQGWGGGLSQQALSELQPPPDQSHRIHIAANDPAFPAKREAAIAIICQAIDAIAIPLGYTRKGTTWSRTTARGKSAIHLQRSQYGFTATLHLRFLTPEGEAPLTSIWAREDDIRLHHFQSPNANPALEQSDLTYLDVSENPACLNAPMHILATRALPWLDAHHAAVIPPDIESYLSR